MRAEAVFMDGNGPVGGLPEQRRGSCAIAFRFDEDGRQQALPFKRYARVWEVFIGNDALIGQEIEKSRFIGQAGQGLRESLAGCQQLGPGAVELVIRQAVNARRQSARLTISIRAINQCLAVAQQEIEAGILRAINLPSVLLGR